MVVPVVVVAVPAVAAVVPAVAVAVLVVGHPVVAVVVVCIDPSRRHSRTVGRRSSSEVHPHRKQQRQLLLPVGYNRHRFGSNRQRRLGTCSMGS